MKKCIALIFLLLVITIFLPFALKQTIVGIEVKDILASFASIFAGICTLLLGIVAVYQNIKANETNKNLQALQLQLSQKASDDKKIDELRKDITDLMISFDMDALKFAINNQSEPDLNPTELRLYNVYKTASDICTKFTLSKYGNQCSDECNSCSRTDCILKTKSKRFVELFSDFKKYYYDSCINKYLTVLNDCNVAIYEVKEYRKKISNISENFEMLMAIKWNKIRNAFDDFNKNEYPELMNKARKCLVQIEHDALQAQKDMIDKIKKS